MPLVISVNCRGPTTQVTANSTVNGAPAAVSIARGLSPATVQFGATPVSRSEWGPGASGESSTDPFTSIGTSTLPSTWTV